MAKTSKKVTAREAARAFGSGWASILAQLLADLNVPIYNADKYREFYKEMLAMDETIGAGIEYLTGRVVSRIGEYSHKDVRIKELVDKCVESIRGTLTAARRSILRDTFSYGYAVAEFTIKAENGQWLLSSMPVLDPASISFKLARFEDNSIGISSVVQRDAGGKEIDIPVGKCLIKTYGSDRTPYGQSILQQCFRWWRFKKSIPQFWAVALERFGQPLMHVKSNSKDPTKREKLEEAMENLNSRGWLVTDSDVEVAAIDTRASSVGASYLEANELCDKQIYRALFLPPLLASGENGGSYSLGQVHLELFNMTCAALATDYIDAELEQLWRPIIEWNFGPQEDYGTWNVTDTMPTDEKKVLSEMFLNLANAGVIDPDTDRKTIREMLSLPEVEEGAVYPKWPLEQEPEQEEV